MNLRQLRNFIEIAQLRSFTRAAEVLHIAQPALSRQIRMIEEDLGAPVFKRYDRGVSLTETGELLRDRVSSLLVQFDQLRDEVIARAGEPRGELTAGLPPSMRQLITVPLVNAYCRRYAEVNLHVQEGISVDLGKLLQEGKLDCAVIVDLAALPFAKSEPFLREQLFLVGPREAQLDMRKPASIKDASDKPMILTSRPNSLRLVFENALGRARLPLKLIADGNSTEMMIELVSCGLGYSVLPYCATWSTLRQGTLSAAPIEDLWIDWVFVSPSQRSLSVAGRKMKDLLFALAKERIDSREWEGAQLA